VDAVAEEAHTHTHTHTHAHTHTHTHIHTRTHTQTHTHTHTHTRRRLSYCVEKCWMLAWHNGNSLTRFSSSPHFTCVGRKRFLLLFLPSPLHFFSPPFHPPALPAIPFLSRTNLTRPNKAESVIRATICTCRCILDHFENRCQLLSPEKRWRRPYLARFELRIMCSFVPYGCAHV
jgi:hypothetical protein